MTTENTNISNNAPRDLNYSRVLDVHVWSNYKEVNDFVSLIYDAYFSSQNGKKSVSKRHIKLVLLDLYVAWITDPDLNVSVTMTRDFYSKSFGTNDSRYNELNISAKTIGVVHTLRENGLIGYVKGKEAEEGFVHGFVSRIWAEPLLVSMFEKAAFHELMIWNEDEREVIVLHGPVEKIKGKKKVKAKPVGYDETEETQSQRLIVQEYNELLERTFIDIGEAETPVLTIEKRAGSKDPDKPHHVHITHKSKWTRRIFNNSSFTNSGRSLVGFWQRIGEDHRKKILINDEETRELDFSSLHPVLAYANAGVDYWKENQVGPYDIAVAGIDDSKVAREIVKKLLLLALNARDEASLFKAFRSEFDYSLLDEEFSFTNPVLSKILDSIKARHSIIADQIATGAGTKLMNLDGKIVEFVIKRFLLSNTPVLSVHDSFIVQTSQRDKLSTAMKDAWVSITGQDVTKYKQNMPMYQDAVAWRHLDYVFYLDRMADLPKAQIRTTGYLNRLNKHNKFFNVKPSKSTSVQYTPDEILMPKKYKKYKK